MLANYQPMVFEKRPKRCEFRLLEQAHEVLSSHICQPLQVQRRTTVSPSSGIRQEFRIFRDNWLLFESLVDIRSLVTNWKSIHTVRSVSLALFRNNGCQLHVQI